MMRFLVLSLLLGGFAGSVLYFALPDHRPNLSDFSDLTSPYALRARLLEHVPERFRPSATETSSELSATPSSEEAQKTDSTPVVVTPLSVSAHPFTLEVVPKSAVATIAERIEQVPGVSVSSRTTNGATTRVVAQFPGEDGERTSVFHESDGQTTVVSQLGGDPAVLESVVSRLTTPVCP